MCRFMTTRPLTNLRVPNAGIELGENGSVAREQRGSLAWPDVLYRDWSSRPPPSGLRGKYRGRKGVNPWPRCASGIRGEPLTLPWSRTRQGREELGENGGVIPRPKGKPRAAS